MLDLILEDVCGVASPHPQTTPASNLWVLCEHLHLAKARQLEFKARIITISRCELCLLGHRYKTYAATNADVHDKRDMGIVFFVILLWGPWASV